MDEKLFIENEIDINAPKEKVWNALTNPVETKKYMFGCEVISDLTVGSSMTWQGVLEGVTMVFVKGNVTEVDPGICWHIPLLTLTLMFLTFPKTILL